MPDPIFEFRDLEIVVATMNPKNSRHIAILYPGDRTVRENATPENNRLASIFKSFRHLAVHAEPVVYHDDFCEEFRQQLLQVDAVLVWYNPVQDGRDRSVLDPMLRDVCAAGVVVSTHPDTILKIGTKEVLYRTRDIGWGSDTHLYRSRDQMRSELPERLASGEARVLKQCRGNGGSGVWRVALNTKSICPHPGTLVQVRHAKKGSVAETITLEQEWVPALQAKLDLATEDLPILWDCDFLLGPKNDQGEDTYVLCEINASSIAPYPESAAPYVARATLERIRSHNYTK
jgi:glutathione synthase/RimK-type ligase-like ATP-grasp enzyme